jgi:XTP/dITP diphosphohydrolase
VKIHIASSNYGKLREYREIAAGSQLGIELLPGLRELPPFEESAPTFAENALGKTLHYSRYSKEIVLADDSGLVVSALGGAPGVRSARYAGPSATDAANVQKLLREMKDKKGGDRRARFVCVIAIALEGRALVIASDFADGIIADEPRGASGFGYDPVFIFPDTGRTFSEIPPEEKNRLSHRGKAFRKVIEYLAPMNSSIPR